MLVTTPARPPLCPQCNSAGHIGMNCISGGSGRADAICDPRLTVVQRQANTDKESIDSDDSMSESEEGNKGEIGDDNRQEGDFRGTEVNDDCLEEGKGVLIQTKEVTVINIV
ncbi:hypothetical protein SNE40_019250 [Patella caerulea]|uniref:Uncharacterized protein n=1 Tax=Patella caerulea TaxID=87958 RepID=A0AAN8J7N2_PATCE